MMGSGRVSSRGLAPVSPELARREGTAAVLDDVVIKAAGWMHRLRRPAPCACLPALGHQFPDLADQLLIHSGILSGQCQVPPRLPSSSCGTPRLRKIPSGFSTHRLMTSGSSALRLTSVTTAARHSLLYSPPG